MRRPLDYETDAVTALPGPPKKATEPPLGTLIVLDAPTPAVSGLNVLSNTRQATSPVTTSVPAGTMRHSV